MKRACLIIIVILLLVIDNTLLPYYSIRGAYPSLLFVFAMAYSIIEGKKEAIFMGILSGFLQDIFFFSGFGVNLFLNFLICIACAEIGTSIYKENRIIPVFTSLAFSVIKVFGVAIILKLFSLELDIYTALLSAILNTVCMLIFYGFILKKLDKYLDRNTWRF